MKKLAPVPATAAPLPVAQPHEEQPTQGGSYLRDTVTGELTRVEHPALDPTDPDHEDNLPDEAADGALGEAPLPGSTPPVDPGGFAPATDPTALVQQEG